MAAWSEWFHCSQTGPNLCYRMELHRYADGSVKVCLTDGGVTVCTTVSSDHLVPDKERQLRAALAMKKGPEGP